jgi:hypothetical protein
MAKRVPIVVATAMIALLAFAPAVAAGEWAPGLNDYNGAAGHGRSECVYNGQDDPDLEDNALWAMTPAKGRVQSGGQAIAAGFVDPGVQGFACNPTRAGGG